MKQIIAYIRPNKLAAVTLALQSIEGLPGMSFSDVRGFGRDRIPQSDPHIVRDLVDYTPYVRVEVFCAEEVAYEVRCRIEQAAHTGGAGDGKLYEVEVGKTSCIQEAESLVSAVGRAFGLFVVEVRMKTGMTVVAETAARLGWRACIGPRVPSVRPRHCSKEKGIDNINPESRMDLLSDEFPWNPDHTLQQPGENSSEPIPLPAGTVIEAPQVPPLVPLALLVKESQPHERQQFRWYGLNEGLTGPTPSSASSRNRTKESGD